MYYFFSNSYLSCNDQYLFSIIYMFYYLYVVLSICDLLLKCSFIKNIYFICLFFVTNGGHFKAKKNRKWGKKVIRF